ncbi:MAG: fused MFS/spermidine synthase [Myxococcales bacterium]|jgi:spermidine synthase|nr:fused MFS/spermidine synthase [Myxococcales bacterium]
MLREVVELSQESGSAAGFEAAVLRLLEREIGCDVAYFSVKGNEANPTVRGLEATIVERAVTRGEIYLKELGPVKRAALAGRGVAVDSEVLGLRLRETKYHRELGRAVGVRHSLMAYVPWGGRVVAALMLGRESPFSEGDVRRMETALPALGVGRAAFGLPWSSKPLRGSARRGLLSRLGVQPRVHSLASVDTPSGTLVVQDRGGFREMIAIDGRSELVWTRAALANPSRSGWPYVDLLHVAAALAGDRGRALFVGCGGGVAMRRFASVYPGIRLDVVEREPAVLELARRWYDLDAIPGLAVHVADGVDFIGRAPPRTWDVVVLDAYDTGALSEAFLRRSFFADLERVLRPEGAVAVNLIGTLDGRGPLRALVGAARAEFSDVRVVPVMTPDEEYAPHAPRNIVVIASGPRRA